jgi:hypothetical protein
MVSAQRREVRLRKVRLEDLPAHLRAGVERQLAAPALAAKARRPARKPVVVRADVFCTRCGSYQHQRQDDPAPCALVREPASGGVPAQTFAGAVRTENVANGAHGHHFAEAGRRDRVRTAIGNAWRAAAIHVRPRYRVTLTRISASELDPQNVDGALKQVFDEVAARLKVDDATPLIEWVRKQERGEPGRPAIRIEVEELP